MVIGEGRDTILKAEDMQRKGFYVLPVRPPTVPEGTSRLRISLTAALTDEGDRPSLHDIGDTLKIEQK